MAASQILVGSPAAYTSQYFNSADAVSRSGQVQVPVAGSGVIVSVPSIRSTSEVLFSVASVTATLAARYAASGAIPALPFVAGTPAGGLTLAIVPGVGFSITVPNPDTSYYAGCILNYQVIG